MAHKKIEGLSESMTYAEVKETKNALLDEFLAYLHSIVDETSSDDDEKASVMLNMSEKLGGLLNMALLEGVLMDQDIYIANLKGSFESKLKGEVTLSISEIEEDAS